MALAGVGRRLGLLEQHLHLLHLGELLGHALAGLTELSLTRHHALGHALAGLAEALAHLTGGLLGLGHLLELLLLLVVEVLVVLEGLLERLGVLRQLRVEPRLLERVLELLLLLRELLELLGDVLELRRSLLFLLLGELAVLGLGL